MQFGEDLESTAHRTAGGEYAWPREEALRAAEILARGTLRFSRGRGVARPRSRSLGHPSSTLRTSCRLSLGVRAASFRVMGRLRRALPRRVVFGDQSAAASRRSGPAHGCSRLLQPHLDVGAVVDVRANKPLQPTSGGHANGERGSMGTAARG